MCFTCPCPLPLAVLRLLHPALQPAPPGRSRASNLVTDLCAEHEWCEAELAQCREAASQLAERVTEAQETQGKAERWLKPLQAALQPLVEASQRAAVQLSQAASLAGSVELVTLAKFQGGQARLEINYLNFVKLIKISLN